MPSTTTQPLELGKPGDIQMCAPANRAKPQLSFCLRRCLTFFFKCVSTWLSHGLTPHPIPPIVCAHSEEDAFACTSPAAKRGAKRPAPSECMDHTPKSARHTTSIAADDEAASPATAAASPGAGSTLPSPSGAFAAAATPNSTAFSPSGSVGTPSASSPDRKIWMRACNGCGFELHVRRVRCTSCGEMQMSKRAYAAALEEKRTAAEKADEEVALAYTSAEAQAEAQAAAEAEEAEAASSLALIASPAKKAPPARADAAAAAAGASTVNVADDQPTSLPPTSPAPSSSSVVSQLARLTPEQITKLRRMQKLRALLAKLPPGTQLPASAGRPAPAAGSSSSSAAHAPSADAIAMLASVACM